ncbi:MAG: shikimate kinase AroK [Gammaproteobacteria bacterium]|nr:shikimate kinase AroK [Gammaproteobacteria bacterium]
MAAGRDSIFLIGPMGSGKSAVGRQLARVLGMSFVDSDHEIEQHTGVDIPMIFDREGEAGFRRREHDILAELTARERVVLATGGGAVLDEDNRRHLASRGWVVYLETSVEQQAERAGRTRHRPLLQGVDPRQRLQELLCIREPLYRATAEFTISTNRRRVPQVVDRIVRAYTADHALRDAQGPPGPPAPAG